MPLTARDVMTSPVTTVTPSTPLAELARLLTEDQISGVPVVDVEARLVGIVSKTDLLERLIDEATEYTSNPSFQKLFNLGEDDDTGTAGTTSDESLDWMPEMAEASDSDSLGTVEDIMEPEVVTVRPNAHVSELASLMSRNRIHRVVVAEGTRVLGIVTSLDLLGRFSSLPSATATNRAVPAAAAPSKKAAAPAKSAKKPTATSASKKPAGSKRGKTKPAPKSKPAKKSTARR